MFNTMKKLFVVNSDATMETETTATKTPEDLYLDRLCDLTEANKQTIGVKTYANIPVELLCIDSAYQREGTYRKDKVTDLINHFDMNRMDTLVVSYHEEEKRYYVVDGMHRLLAALAKGVQTLPCEIKFFPGNPKERRIGEARYFIEQGIQVDPMSPIDQHNGHVLCGDHEYVVLDEAVKATEGKIFLKHNRNKGKQLPGTLTGYVAAVTLARKNKRLLQDVFEVLIEAGWSNASTGLSNYSLRMVGDVLAIHNDLEVKKEIARVLRGIEPKLFRAKAQAAYELRTASEANSLYLEDYVCTNLGIERLIDAKGGNRFNPTKEKPVA